MAFAPKPRRAATLAGAGGACCASLWQRYGTLAACPPRGGAEARLRRRFLPVNPGGQHGWVDQIGGSERAGGVLAILAVPSRAVGHVVRTHALLRSGCRRRSPLIPATAS